MHMPRYIAGPIALWSNTKQCVFPGVYARSQTSRTDRLLLKSRVQSRRETRSDRQRLEKGRSRQLLQTEHVSFLLAALLETPHCL
jgi:hypothetical protein